MATKVTFKKHPALTGLAAVGHTQQSIDCKIKKKMFGTIDAPTWQTKDRKWSVRIMIMKTEPDGNPNCDWKWIACKFRFDDAEQAKQWLQSNIETIQQRYTLRFCED